MSNRLEVIDAAKSFGGVLALSEATLTAESRRILAIIGPNGAGKTTLINVVSGVYAPDAGRVLLNGTDITGPAGPFEVARHGIARTFQNVALFAGMTVLDNILLGRNMLMKSGVLKCGVFWGAARSEEIEHRRRAEEVIDFLNITDIRTAPAGSLPLGLQKRVELGRALAADPKVLLLDEPMGGMNLEEKESICRYVLDVVEMSDTAVILIEHDMGVVMDISDHIIVLDQGRKISEGDARPRAQRQGRHRGVLGEGTRGLTRSERSMTGDTLAKILQANRRGPLAGRDAIREKEYGIWQTVTWAEYAEEVRRFALGLAKLGFRRGDKLAVIGDNRRRLYFAQLAAQSLGGVSLAAYQDSIAAELGYVLEHAETKIIVAENEEQVDKLFEIRERLGNVEKVIFDDPRGLELVDDPWLAYFPDVQPWATTSGDSTRITSTASSRPAGARTPRCSATRRAPPARPRGRCSPTTTCSPPSRNRESPRTGEPETSSSPTCPWRGSAIRGCRWRPRSASASPSTARRTATPRGGTSGRSE